MRKSQNILMANTKWKNPFNRYRHIHPRIILKWVKNNTVKWLILQIFEIKRRIYWIFLVELGLDK